MISKKIIVFFILVITIFVLFFRERVNPRGRPAEPRLVAEERNEFDYTGEKIIYKITPVGISEYTDLGFIKVDGESFRFATFRTQALGLDDTEKIYSDPDTHLPLRVERDISMWTGKEYLVEEYDQKNFTLLIRKFKGNRKVREYVFKSDGPIGNAVILPFSLRRIPQLDVGFTIQVRFPYEYTITLNSIEEVEVPAGKFRAYHFTSTPEKFEIWITDDHSRIPIKIKGLGGLSYTLSMKERIFK